MKSMKLSAANIPGTIKAVSITTSHSDESNKKQAELSVKVGGKNFGSRKNLVNDMTKYTFTGTSAASGEIEINWKSGSEGLSYFIRSVEVIYQK